MMPKCVFCNTSVSPGSQNCPKCGAALRLDDEPAREGSGAVQPDELLALAREGRTIEAINIYRARTRAGLKEPNGPIEMLLAPAHPPTPQVHPIPPAASDEF